METGDKENIIPLIDKKNANPEKARQRISVVWSPSFVTLKNSPPM